MQTTTLALDFRVTVLEKNGGVDGNSAVAELEVRVETLEGTAADHGTRLTSTAADIEGLTSKREQISVAIMRSDNKSMHSCIFSIFVALETATSDQEVRLSAAEENIQGTMCTLQMSQL